MLSIMPRIARRRPIFLSQAATAIFALASTSIPPSTAFVHSAWSPSKNTGTAKSFATRGLSTKQPLDSTSADSSASLSRKTTLEAATVVDVEDIMMGNMTPAEKLDALRKEMKEKGLDVYLVPSDDPHLSGRLTSG